MSHFLTPLHADILDDQDVQLLAPFVFHSDILGKTIEIPAGFVTDFASVPRAPGAYWLLGGRCKWEAVIHDYLYRVMHVGRRVADDVFLEAMRTPRIRTINGKPKRWRQPAWVRAGMWSGVRAGGAFSYGGPSDPQPEEPYDPSPGA